MPPNGETLVHINTYICTQMQKIDNEMDKEQVRNMTNKPNILNEIETTFGF